MSRSETARNSITLTIEDGPSQDDPNTPSVAMEIINRRRQEQAVGNGQRGYNFFGQLGTTP